MKHKLCNTICCADTPSKIRENCGRRYLTHVVSMNDTWQLAKIVIRCNPVNYTTAAAADADNKLIRHGLKRVYYVYYRIDKILINRAYMRNRKCAVSGWRDL